MSKEKTFQAAAEPLIKWLAEKEHPHHVVIVDSTSAQLFESKKSFTTDKFLKD